MSDIGAPTIHSDMNCLHCEQCGLPLPLQLAKTDEPAMTCRCTGCGAKYRGNVDPEHALSLASNIAPAASSNDSPPLAPEAVAKLLESIAESYEGPERRTADRTPVAIGVSIQPTDEHFNPMGTSFIAISRNVSTGGISLMHTSPISAPFLIVEMPAKADEPVTGRLQVLRCRPVDGCYEITGQFVVGDHDTQFSQTRDVRLSSAAWQVVDAVAVVLKQSPDCVLQSLILSDRSQAHRCRTRLLADLAQGKQPNLD